VSFSRALNALAIVRVELIDLFDRTAAKGVAPQGFDRHTYASVRLMLGANLVSVQKLLGHSDPKITAEWERLAGVARASHAASYT
jgi:site-specific recombinase XerD